MLEDFLVFVREQGLADTDFPDDDPLFKTVYDLACQLSDSPPLILMPQLILDYARFNLAFHLLIVYTPRSRFMPYAGLMRFKNSMLSLFPMGLTNSGSDAGTSFSNETMIWAKGFSMKDLYYMATPYGREWLSFVQSYGSGMGLTKN